MKAEYKTNIEEVADNVLILLKSNYLVRTKDLTEEFYKVTDIKPKVAGFISSGNVQNIKKGTKVQVLSSMWQPEDKKGNKRFRVQ
jgi:hypothetical protein